MQSKGLSRVFSSTTVRKHHFFSAQTEKSSGGLQDENLGLWEEGQAELSYLLPEPLFFSDPYNLGKEEGELEGHHSTQPPGDILGPTKASPSSCPTPPGPT